MTNIDWNKVKFRASSWGNLNTEPVTKAAKEAGELSKTCQTELIKIYNQVKYGRKADITTPQMIKGTMVEDDSISLFSRVEGDIYYKNTDSLENDYFTGHPDIYKGENILSAELVYDIKSSWTVDTYIPKLIEGADKSYEAQLNVYYDLTGASGGAIVYCLVDAPFSVLEGEKRKLLYNMDVISEESPEYLQAAAHLEKQLTFEDIDYRERVIKVPVPRNQELIDKMKAKVPLLRKWLSEFHQTHMNQYPKL